MFSNGESKSTKMTIKNEKEKEKKVKEVDVDLSLHDAVYYPENIDEIKSLVSKYPELVSQRDNDNRTPLHTVAHAGDEEAGEIAMILLGVTENDDLSLINIDRPEVLNFQDSTNSIGLHYAAHGRQPELVASLLRWGSNASIQNGEGNNCLHLVAEGNTEEALEVAKIILDNDSTGALVNCKNKKEQTPFHVAISKKAVTMVNFLLEQKYKCDLSLKNELGQTAFHIACSKIGESESSCEIVEALLQRINKTQLNQIDRRGRTGLHLAAIKRLPKIIKILVEDDRTDVLKTDEKGRMALHYATADGCYTKGNQSVEILITRKFAEYTDQVKYMFKMKDESENTAFMYACINCPSETMKKYTDVCPYPQYWLTSINMTLLYNNAPSALKPLMDKAFSEVESDTREGEYIIQTDFGLITGYTDPIEELSQPETKYLKESLWWDWSAKEDILWHPLVQLFVMKKWERLKWIIAAWVFCQCMWLIANTSLGVSFYSINPNSNTSTNEATTSHGSKAATYLGSCVMFVYLVGSLTNEAFELFNDASSYVLSLRNVLQFIQCVLGFIAIFPVFLGYDCPENWMKYTAAAGVLLAYILSMRDIGKLHPEIGIIVETLKRVLAQIVLVLVSCSLLWIGFTIAFYIIFNDQDVWNSSFPGPIVKVLVMMTGEFEYNNTFQDEDES